MNDEYKKLNFNKSIQCQNMSKNSKINEIIWFTFSVLFIIIFNIAFIILFIAKLYIFFTIVFIFLALLCFNLFSIRYLILEYNSTIVSMKLLNDDLVEFSSRVKSVEVDIRKIEKIELLRRRFIIYSENIKITFNIISIEDYWDIISKILCSNVKMGYGLRLYLFFYKK